MSEDKSTPILPGGEVMSDISEADRAIMGTPEVAKAALIAKAVEWRRLRQPSMDTAAGHRKTEMAEREARFQLANAALLWLWHEENPAAATPAHLERDRIAETIGWYLACVVSSNNQPHMSGDPRNRIHSGKRRHFDDACLACADAILALSPAPDRGAVEPVAWRTPMKTSGHQLTSDKEIADRWRDNGAAVEPLYVGGSPSATGWQPIDTAPRGEVILYFPKKEQRRGEYLPAMIRVDQASAFPFRQPTHWMPIPAPPAAKET